MVLAFWKFKNKALKHPSNYRLHAILILKVLKDPESGSEHILLLYFHVALLHKTLHCDFFLEGKACMAFQHCVLSKKKTKRKLLFVLDHSAEEVVLSVLHPSSLHWDKSIFKDSFICFCWDYSRALRCTFFGEWKSQCSSKSFYSTSVQKRAKNVQKRAKTCKKRAKTCKDV